MIVERVAYGIARSIKNANPEQTAKKSTLYYGLKIIVNAVFIVALALTIGFILGSSKEVLLGALCFSLLRFVTGGYHLESSDWCVIVSVLTLITIPILAWYQLNFIISCISVLLILLFSPSQMELQFKKYSNKYSLIFKFAALCIVCVNLFFIKSSIASSAFFIQSLTLINFRK